MREYLIAFDLHQPTDEEYQRAVEMLATVGMYTRIGVNAIQLPRGIASGLSSISPQRLQTQLLAGMDDRGLRLTNLIVAEVADWAALQRPV